MSKIITTLICLFLSVSVTAETVYKKTNPDGSVTFTDQASTNSKEIKLRKPSSYKPVQLPSLGLPSKKLSPKFDYVVSISQPAKDAVIVNKQEVTVSASIQPALKRAYGHKLRFQLAGQTMESASSSVTFKNIERGTLIVSVSVINQVGDIVSPVALSSFHVKRFFKKAKP